MDVGGEKELWDPSFRAGQGQALLGLKQRPGRATLSAAGGPSPGQAQRNPPPDRVCRYGVDKRSAAQLAGVMPPSDRRLLEALLKPSTPKAAVALLAGVTPPRQVPSRGAHLWRGLPQRCSRRLQIPGRLKLGSGHQDLLFKAPGTALGRPRPPR